jgi:hypothetical protein
MSVTFVTAFHPVRSGLETYLEKFEKIVSTGVPILLFLDQSCPLPKSYENVRVIYTTLDKDWIPEDVTLPSNRSPTKDTKEYLLLMLNKLKYLDEASRLCDTPYLAWIDFGISHIIRTDSTFKKLSLLLSFSEPLKTILVPGCWNPPGPSVDLWSSVYWRFCGGFLLGPRDLFPAAYHRQTELVVSNLPRITWEVNYWTMMESFFTWYAADHDDSMILNFPYTPCIQRLTRDPYYLAGSRKVAVGGPIEQYVMSLLQPNMIAVFPKTDMVVESSEFARMRASSWEDPAIQDIGRVLGSVKQMQGMRPIVCVDTSRKITSPNVLLLPSDDTSFLEGVSLPHELPSWESRKPVAVWRGASSGCEHPSLRKRTSDILRSNAGVDFRFVRGGWPQNDVQIDPDLFGDSMTIQQQLEYKYIFSIEGNGAASNIEWAFASGAVPIVISTMGVDFWFKHKLQDGVNCILVESDNLNTLPERLAWLQENDEEARKIAERAVVFSKTELSPEAQRAYLRSQIEERIPYACDWCEYSNPKGEHHTFLTEIAKSYRNQTFLDIGTHIGASAYALSREPTNRVISFDLVHKRVLPKIPNVQYSLDNLMTPEGRAKWESTILSSAVILLDIDPHEGTQEYEFYEWLRDRDYKGILICDDIWWFEGMRRNFWYKIPYEHKIDVTDQGHVSGTGIVRFHPTPRWPANPPISNWTVVTGYFDLTRMPDASPSIKGRPFEHYLQHSASTLMLDQNMIIFCEPHTIEAIRARRPRNLDAKTRYIVMKFEDFPMCKYREDLNQIRKSRPSADDRNTVSYYLLCMARYAMLKQAIASNPFGSTHFLWLNICIERMGIRNVRELSRVFQVQREKFSTCYIDYQPKENYLEQVMRWGRCSMCSGFFTGNAKYMKEFCDRIEEKFVDCVSAGYGHADEQLYSLVYFDAPGIFDVYYGDYTEMITNYEWVKERASEPLRLLITHSYNAGDFNTCRPACEKLWESYVRGYAHLTSEEVAYLTLLRKKLAEI